jgi:TorA maturation chaperone TorD
MEHPNIARARASLYRLASRMVGREPDESFLNRLHSPPFKEAITGLGLSPPPLPSPEEAEDAFTEMDSEFARLFLLPGAPLQPFQSIRRGEERLWGETTVAVEQTYKEAGYELNPESGYIPDHLSVELEFMAHLAEEEASSMEAGDETKAKALEDIQRNFLKDYLGDWALEFAKNLEQETSHPYFRFVARLIQITLDSDLSRFNLQKSG